MSDVTQPPDLASATSVPPPMTEAELEAVRSPALFAKLGMEKLTAVMTDFYDRLFRDVMIGFMFQGKDKAHLIARETELTAKMLGAPGVTYTGRPMRTAHGSHTIFGGHFERRLEVLRQVLAAHAVDPDVVRVWIDHTQLLRHTVTRDTGSECKDTNEGRPKLDLAAPAPSPDALVKLKRRS